VAVYLPAPKIVLEHSLQFIIAWNFASLFPLLTAKVIRFIPDFGADIADFFEFGKFWNFSFSRQIHNNNLPIKQDKCFGFHPHRERWGLPADRVKNGI
jgi:hypothetical protein